MPSIASAADTLAYQLGHTPEAGFPGENPPHFKLYGVGPDSTLVSYDLLQPAPPDLQISDGIVELRALYGIDTSATLDGVLDAWVDATGDYAAALLTDGSVASQTKLGRIVAVRVGMILRTTLKERAPSSTSGAVGPEAFGQSNDASRTLFADLPGLTYTRPLGADAGYRFRTVESTIPLRNVLLADRP